MPQRFPSLDRSLLEEMAFISRNLRGDRERSMYGDEILGLSPDRLYSQFDGETAQGWAEKVFGVCAGLLRNNREERLFASLPLVTSGNLTLVFFFHFNPNLGKREKLLLKMAPVFKPKFMSWV
jgi:hypothetical protein